MALDLYIIKKYVMAKNIKDALEKEKKHPCSEIYMDADWKNAKQEKQPKMGFK